MPYKYVLLASMLATAGDLVFTGNPEGEFFALDAKTGNKLVELSNRRRPSRSGRLLCGQRPAVYRDRHRMAQFRGRSRRSRLVPRSGLAPGLDAGSIRPAGGIAMKPLLAMLALAAFVLRPKCRRRGEARRTSVREDLRDRILPRSQRRPERRSAPGGPRVSIKPTSRTSSGAACPTPAWHPSQPASRARN